MVALGELHERTGSLPGLVIGRWADDQALVRLADGRVFELPAPPEVSDFDIGDRVDVYLDSDAAIAGWYLPDKGHGVDLRGWGSADER
jgi:hypothetical protein